MNPSRAVVRLSSVLILLTLVATGVGLFFQDEGTPRSFTTLRGESVEIYGTGLYRYDTVFAAAGNRGVDLMVLGLALPLLLVTTTLYRRGSIRGSLLHFGMLGFFVYLYATMALGAAYNELFAVYVVLFSAGLFALGTTYASIDQQILASCASPQSPRRGPAFFLFAGGLLTLFVWGEPIVSALLTGQTPQLLTSYTTLVTYALDLAIITPMSFVAATLLLRRSIRGTLFAMPLLAILILLTPQIASQTVFQLRAGISFSLGEILGPMIGFAVFGLLALAFLIGILRCISSPSRSVGHRITR